MRGAGTWPVEQFARDVLTAPTAPMEIRWQFDQAISVALLAITLVAGILTLAAPTRAQDTCGGIFVISYPVLPSFNNLGSIDRVRLTVGAGDIVGGTTETLTVSSVFFDLRCQAALLSTGCTDEVVPAGQNPVVAFNGNITTTCQSTVATAHAIGPNPNQVVFTFTPALVIPTNTPSLCSLEFDVQKTAPQSWDTTPLIIEELAGLMDARCENGLFAANTVTGSIGIDVTPTPTSTVTPTTTRTPTITPTNTPTLTPTASPSPPPPIPVVPTPTSPAGLVLIGGLGLAIAWMLRRAGLASFP